MGIFNDTRLWVVKKNKQRGKTFKYVYIRSAKEANRLSENKVKIIIHFSVVSECPVVFLYIFWLCLRLF